MSKELPSSSNTILSYSPESPVEIVRQTEESWLFTKMMGGPLAGLPDGLQFHQVLNVACGPGDWALDLAFAYPHMEVAGVDFNAGIIRYAIAKARSQQVKNVSFEAMNWLEACDFSDNTFDLIYGRFLVGLVQSQQWPGILQNFMRILRPGGILCLTDSDLILTTSAANEKLNALLIQSLQILGYGFSPSGRSLGITPRLGHLLRQAGFIDINKTAYVIDFSTGTDAWSDLYHSFEISGESLLSIIVQAGLASKEEADELHQQAILSMLDDDFGGIWPVLNVWGSRP